MEYKKTNTNKMSHDKLKFSHGLLSKEISHAGLIQKHIVVIGCLDNVLLFIRELRKPQQGDLSYHSVLIVGKQVPAKWGYIKKHYHDIYFFQKRVRSSGDEELADMNIKQAHSLVLLASRDRKSLDEATNIDSAAIFTYLKMHAHVPRHVFFTVELFLASSIGMLNSVIMRHLQRTEHEQAALARKNSTVHTGIAVSRTRRRCSSIKVAGSVETALMFEELSLLSLTQTNVGLSAEQHHTMLCDIIAERELKKERKTSFLFDGMQHSATNGSRQRSDSLMFSSIESAGRVFQKEYEAGECKVHPAADDQQDEYVKPSAAKDGAARQASLFWSTDATHHTLPVYAASMAFVSTGFDSIFCNVSEGPDFCIPLSPVHYMF